jgi:hypothetical protein
MSALHRDVASSIKRKSAMLPRFRRKARPRQGFVFLSLHALVLVALCALLSLAPPPAAAKEGPVSLSAMNGLAISGYDAVAYFDEGRPVKGDKAYEYRWMGAVWRFANAERRDKFAARPERYAPQFGGYCAWAVGHGYTAPADPMAWRIVDGKLYLNYNTDVQKRWEAQMQALIAKGDENWPKVLSGKASKP